MFGTLRPRHIWLALALISAMVVITSLSPSPAFAQDDLGRVLEREKIAAQKLQSDVT